MRPSTRQVAAPCRLISEMFTSGVSSGQNTTDSMPARDAYAASAAPALPLVGHGEAAKTQLLRHGYGKRQPARLERAGGKPSLVLHQQRSAAAVRPREGNEGRRHLPERDPVHRLAHGKELPVPPESVRAGGQVLAAERSRDGVEVVADEEWPAGRREPVHLSGRE